MSSNRKRFWRSNFSGISLTLIGLLGAAAVTVAYMNLSIPPIRLGAEQSTGR
jgi:hypothetical protein